MRFVFDDDTFAEAKVTFFKISGKYYTDDSIAVSIPTGTYSYSELLYTVNSLFTDKLRDKAIDMRMCILDKAHIYSEDGGDMYIDIVPISVNPLGTDL